MMAKTEYQEMAVLKRESFAVHVGHCVCKCITGDTERALYEDKIYPKSSRELAPGIH